MKLHSLSDLGSIYGNIAETNKNKPSIPNEAKQAEVLLTDATQYVPVKAGSALGGGPGAKGDEVKLAKKTGPEAADNFEKVNDKADPGSDKKEMEDVVNNEDEENEEGETSHDAAKNTTSKEKVEKIVAEEHKYNYKPKFNMSKPKFDQLYEAALKRVPFTEADDNMSAEADMGAPEADMGVPSATDAAADSEGSSEESNDVTITLPKEMAMKLCDLLKAACGEEEQGEEGEQEVEAGADDVMAEDVEAEDRGHALHGSGVKTEMGHDGHKIKTVGDIKKSGGTADKGKIKNEPEPKEEKGNNAALQGKNNKVGSGTVASTGKKIFD
jgi:hypothetical protein